MVRNGLRFCLLLAMPGLMACASVPAIFLSGFGENVVPEVNETAEAYNQDLRWGRIPQAAAAMVPEQREKFVELFDGDPGVFRFTSVEVLSAIPTSIAGREVDVLVAWEFYNPPALTERKLRQKQKWHFLELERRWEVTPDLAVFEEAAHFAKTGGVVPASRQR